MLKNKKFLLLTLFAVSFAFALTAWAALTGTPFAVTYDNAVLSVTGTAGSQDVTIIPIVKVGIPLKSLVINASQDTAVSIDSVQTASIPTWLTVVNKNIPSHDITITLSGTPDKAGLQKPVFVTVSSDATTPQYAQLTVSFDVASGDTSYVLPSSTALSVQPGLTVDCVFTMPNVTAAAKALIMAALQSTTTGVIISGDTAFTVTHANIAESLSGTTLTVTVPVKAASTVAVGKSAKVSLPAISPDHYNPIAAKADAFTITSTSVTSADMTLKALTVNIGTLTPVFSSATKSYTVTVSPDISSIALTATATDAANTAIKATRDTDVSVDMTSGSSRSFTLGADGTTTTITIVVSDKNAPTSNTTYVVSVLRGSIISVPDDTAVSTTYPRDWITQITTANNVTTFETRTPWKLPVPSSISAYVWGLKSGATVSIERGGATLVSGSAVLATRSATVMASSATDTYLVIKGKAVNEAAARASRINGIFYTVGGVNYYQPVDILVSNTSVSTVNSENGSSGGCNAGLGLFGLGAVLLGLSKVAARKKK